jgi:hypothetical protein
VGDPASSIFSEIYLEYIENTVVCDILLKYHIVGYFRCVDDILIVYNKTTSNIYDVFNAFINLMPTMKFTIEEEKEYKINFLDITILKENDNLSFNIPGNQLQQILSFPIILVIHKNINLQQ